MLLLGNEAIVRGALEAGVAFATAYPGTPSSEVPLNFYQIKQETDLYFEYSTNEKVALEVAAGAAVSGLRTMVTMKHVGVNVAADPLMTLAYTGVNGGMVILTADDPSLFSSQNEQDNRFFARLATLPMLEPTTPQEAKDMTIYAFELSEQLKLPVLLRTTTRINHSRGIVTLGEMKPRATQGSFAKDPFSYVTVPAVSRNLHIKLLKKYDQALEVAERSPFNEIIGQGKWGIITQGVSYCYVRDALEELQVSGAFSVLKLGFSYPFPQQLVQEFLSRVEKVLIVEELEPIMEEAVQAAAQRAGRLIPIRGKGVGELSRLYENEPVRVKKSIAAYFDLNYQPLDPVDVADLPALPGRPPNLCPGCPHRSTFYAVKKVAGEEAIYPTDIGCYTLGILPPLSIADFVICMGSSASSAAGFARATDKPVIAFIGDSTFFHSGITGLVNAFHNNHKFTLVILDNGTTAMTGSQPHPGVSLAPPGFPGVHIPIPRVVQALGVDQLWEVNPFKYKESLAAAKAALAAKGVRVLISRALCVLYEARLTGKKRQARFQVTRGCGECRDCLDNFGCPAMYLEAGEKGRLQIDPDLCSGCAFCVQWCKNIRPVGAHG
jgi:indolepyruvate ferredoxin oxidoreductase alpha subunit